MNLLCKILLGIPLFGLRDIYPLLYETTRTALLQGEEQSA